ncbi:TetR/AcrR family transcriptional regulator [Nocardioides sp. BYT-33-1]|uniref:TetR/AcrR family transcriptional regulator n=1 Tax=Nocardioides sp. BYT-33-1 TaxID=3416952 RepID=UPI003F535649
MSTPGTTAWVDRRAPAVERILDAAGALFAEHGVDGVAMGEIAAAAGCSRATLYRYFPDRPALQLAFVQREAIRVGALVVADLNELDGPDGTDGPGGRAGPDGPDGPGPAGRLVTEAVLSALRHVRRAPTLAAWFRETDAGRAADLAHGSEVIEALGLTVTSDPDAARWLVRVIVSLLTVPGGDAAEERRLVERFVAPVIALTAP